MQNLTKLFRLLEISRAQPQYGYVLAEIPKSDLSDLAQHHYLVTFIAWQLARLIRNAGGTIDIEKVLEISLIHDLGEIFGGDIAKPYAIANPVALDLAKKFEAENFRYLSGLFGEEETHFNDLAAEAIKPTTAEGIVAKIADYIEVTHYKLYAHRLSKNDVVMASHRMQELIAGINDTKVTKSLTPFIEQWAKDLGDGKLEEIFESFKD